jgi:peptidoglycan L-alanyl-D-glutamate endopeptidase CwlK
MGTLVPTPKTFPSLAEALVGKEVPSEIKNTLVLITVPYTSFEGKVSEGQLVVHRDVADEMQKIFKELSVLKFPIAKIIPIVAYDWDDDASMADNNTSAFNYRLIHGTDLLSNHSYGLAIDINPALNPYTQYDGVVVPPGALYDITKPGTVTTDIVSIFKSYGWEWGGECLPTKDFQHFQKKI